MRTKLLAAILGIASPLALASGQQVGNGGHLVRGNCYEPSMTGTELLDFYEGKRLRGWSYDLGGAGLSIYQKAEVALDRLERVDAGRAARYREWLATFPSEMTILPVGIRLTDTADTGTYEIPTGCSKGQLAKQVTPQSPEDKRYFIDATNWAAIDDDSKAGLVLHEIVYRDALERGHRNSALVRYVVGLIASPYLETLTREQYESRMLDKFMIGYTWTSDSAVHYRYFDEMRVDYATAKRHCEELPGYSLLAGTSFWNSYWTSFVVGAIGRKILGEDGLGTETYWVASSTTQVQVQNVPGQSRNAEQSETHGVVCYVVGYSGL